MKTFDDLRKLLNDQYFVDQEKITAKLIGVFGRRILDEGYETFPGFDGYVEEIERREYRYVNDAVVGTEENEFYGVVVSAYVFAANNMYQRSWYTALRHLAHVANFMDQGINSKSYSDAVALISQRGAGVEILYSLFEQQVIQNEKGR